MSRPQRELRIRNVRVSIDGRLSTPVNLHLNEGTDRGAYAGLTREEARELCTLLENYFLRTKA